MLTVEEAQAYEEILKLSKELGFVAKVTSVFMVYDDEDILCCSENGGDVLAFLRGVRYGRSK